MDFYIRGMLDTQMANFLSADAHVGHDHEGNVLVNGEVLSATVVNQIYSAAGSKQQEVSHEQ